MNIERLAYSPEDAAATANVPVAVVLDAVAEKRLPARWVDRNTFAIPRRDLMEWIQNLRAEEPTNKDEIILALQQRIRELEYQILASTSPTPMLRTADPVRVPRKPKHLYFMRCDGRIKIGVSQNPARRLKQVRAGSAMIPLGMDPSATELVRVIENAGAGERDLHRRFSHLRQAGEWFRETPELTEYVNSLRVVAA